MTQLGDETAGRFRGAGFFMLAFVLLLAALMVALPLMFGWLADVSLRYLISAAAEAALAIPTLVYARVRRIRLAALFGRADFTQILVAAFAGMLAVPVSMALGVVWEFVVFTTGGNIAAEEIPVPQTLWQLAAALLATGVAAPLVEEPAYRGITLSAHAGMFGRNRAILFTALLFALVHGRFIGLPSILLVGVMITAIAWHSGSVWPAVSAHAAYNALTMLAAMLMKSLSAELPAQEFARDTVSAAQLAAAAVAWVVLALPFAAGCAAVLSAYFRHTPRSDRPAGRPAARLTVSAAWPWLASLFLLLAYLSIDVLRVYGIIHS